MNYMMFGMAFWSIIYAMFGFSIKEMLETEIWFLDKKKSPSESITIMGRPLGLIIISAFAMSFGLDLLPENPFIFSYDRYHRPDNNLYACVLGGTVLTAAFGLFYLKEWGRKTVFCILLITALFHGVAVLSLASLLHESEIMIRFVAGLINIVALTLSVFYLSRDWVKELFLPKAFG